MTKLLHCQIKVKGHLTDEWSDWFSGLAITNLPGGEAVLSGDLPDQAALYGVLDRLRDLGVRLISASCSPANEGDMRQSDEDTVTPDQEKKSAALAGSGRKLPPQ